MADDSSMLCSLPLNLRHLNTNSTSIVYDVDGLESLAGSSGLLLITGRGASVPPLPGWLVPETTGKVARALSREEAEKAAGHERLAIFCNMETARLLCARNSRAEILVSIGAQDSQLSEAIRASLPGEQGLEFEQIALRDPLLWSGLHLDTLLDPALRYSRYESNNDWMSRGAIMSLAAEALGISREDLLNLAASRQGISQIETEEVLANISPSLSQIISDTRNGTSLVHDLWRTYSEALRYQREGIPPRVSVQRLLDSDENLIIMLYSLSESRLEWIQALMAEGRRGASILGRCLICEESAQTQAGCLAAAVAGQTDPEALAGLIATLEDSLDATSIAPAIEAVLRLPSEEMSLAARALAGTRAASRVLENSRPSRGASALEDSSIQDALTTTNSLRASLLFQLGRSAEQRGDWRLAANKYREAWQTDSSVSLYLTRLVHALNALEEYEQAIAVLEEAPEALRSDPHYILGRSQSYAGLGWLEEAITLSTQVTEEVSTLAEAWVTTGKLLTKQGKFIEAETMLEQAIFLAPDSFAAHHYLGEGRASLGDLRMALLNLDRASKLAPGSMETLEALATIEMRIGAYERAAAHFETVLASNPGNRSARLKYAEALERTGREAQASELWQEMLSESAEDWDALVEIGAAQRKAGRYNEAIRTLKRAIASNPSSAAAFLELACAIEESGETEEALQELENAVERFPDDASFLFNLGRIHKLQGNVEKAVASLAAAVQCDGTLGEAHYELAQVYEIQGNLEAALSSYESAIAAAPAIGEYEAKAGFVCAQLCRHKEAIGHLNRAIDLGVHSAPVYARLGEALEHEGAYERAMAAFRQAAEIDSQNPHYHKALSACALSLERFNEALKEAKRAASISSQDTETLALMARSYIALGQLPQAVAVLTSAVTLPDGEYLRVDLASAYRQAGMHEEAKRELSIALESEEHNPRAHKEMAELLLEEGDEEHAIEELHRAVTKMPHDWDSRLALANMLDKRGQTKKALEHLQEAARLAPDRASIFTHLGDIQEKQGALRAAEASYRRALELAPSSPQVMVALARVLRAIGKTDAALKLLREAESLTPESASLQYQLGIALLDQDSPEEAAVHLESVARLGDVPANYHSFLGQAYLESGRTDDAIAVLEKGIAIAEQDPVLRQRLAEAFAIQGWYKEATSQLAMALRQHPKNANLRIAMARLLLQQGRTKAALLELQQAARLDPDDPTALSELGRLLLRVGQPQEALPVLMRSLALVPDSIQRKLDLAEANLAAGDPRRALELGQEICRDHPEQATAQHMVALAQEKLAEIGPAIEAARTAVALAPDNGYFHSTLAKLLLREGNQEEALAEAQIAVEISPNNPETLLNMAALSHASGRSEEAEKWYARVLELDEHHGIAHREIGRLALQRNDAEQAIRSLEKATTLLPNDLESYRLATEAHAKAGYIAEATSYARQSATLAPTDVHAQVRLVQLLRQKGDLTDAEKVLSAIPEELPNVEGIVSIEWARVRAAREDYRGAMKSYQKALEEAAQRLDTLLEMSECALTWQKSAEIKRQCGLVTDFPEDRVLDSLVHLLSKFRPSPSLEPSFHSVKARLLSTTGALQDALAVFKQAINQNPRNAALHREYALALSASQQFRESLQQLVAADRIKPGDAQTALSIGDVLLQMGDKEKAEQAYRRAADISPTDPYTLYRVSASLESMGYVSEAVQPLIAALEHKPEEDSWWNHLSEMQLSLRRFQSALEAAQNATRLKPRNPIYLRNLSTAYAGMRRFQSATRTLEQALELTPSRADWLSELAQLYEKSGETARASQAYRRAAGLEPDNPTHQIGLGNTLAQMGRLKEASQCLQQALERHPGLGEAHAALGRLRYHEGKEEEAIQYFRRAIELEPYKHQYHQELAALLFFMGDTKQALEEAETAASLEAGDPENYLIMARAFAALNRPDEAIQAFEQALVLEPDNADIHHAIGELCRQIGHYDNAVEHFRRVIELRPMDAEARNQLGLTLEHCNELDRALAQYMRAIELEPEEPEYFFSAGRIYKRRKEYAEAQSMFRQVLALEPTNGEAYKQLAAVSALNLVAGEARAASR